MVTMLIIISQAGLESGDGYSRHGTAGLSVSPVSSVNRQIGHCLTRMERVTNIEQDQGKYGVKLEGLQSQTQLF